MTIKKLQKTLRSLANPEIAEHALRFMKAGKGEYGYGDNFLGIRISTLRTQLKKNRTLAIEDTLTLLSSKYHEERWFALQLLVWKFQKGTAEERKGIYDLYIKNIEYVNNWDLVDCSAPKITGPYLENRNRRILYRLAKSKSIWERRIAVMSTFHFIRSYDFDDTLQISTLLLNDKEDLIHKAVGWMLREVGNRDKITEKKFLKKHYRDMPRTILRYAIEKFPEGERKSYLRGEI